MYKNPAYIKKLKAIDKSYMKTEAYSKSLRKDDMPELRVYAGKVHRLTKKTYALYENEINPNRYTRAVAGTLNAYHLDHKISIRYGFDNKIAPSELAKKENLQVIPWVDNVRKGKKCLSLG